MGAYLSEPVTEKQTESAKGENGIQYGATSMQGWRISQEDAHNCILNFDDNCHLFAVYDGHGGAEVAQYAAHKFPAFLKSTPIWNDGRTGQALEDAFLSFDELITQNDTMDELKGLAGTKKENESDGDAEEDKALLYEEAGLPLDDVLRRYGLTRTVLVRSTNRRLVSPKGKLNRDKRVSVTISEDGNGPGTPPSSPETKAATTISSTIGKGKEKSNQENTEALPSSPPSIDGDPSSQERRTRFAVKRKSAVDDDDDGTPPLNEAAGEPGTKNGACEASEPNGIEKSGVDAADLPMGKVYVKRFKDDPSEAKDMTADSTTPIDAPPADAGPVVNGARSVHAGRIEEEARVDSTSGDDGQPKNTNTINTNAALMTDNPDGKAAGDEPTSTAQVSDGKQAGKSNAVDESSGASEDEEDEDFNMDVEDEESSEESSESDEEDEGLEEDELAVGEEGEDAEEEEEEMFEMPSGDKPGVDSGTTACVVLIRGSTIYIANAGDSRCVLCRGDKAIDLSTDHKPEDTQERKRIESAGGKVTADGRVNGGLNLSRAIGDHFYKRNSELPLRDQMITALPDVRVEPMQERDQFLVLACDGIWNSMSSQDVVDFVRMRLEKNLEPAAICEELCNICLAPNTVGDGTGCDNMTVIVVLLKQKDSLSSNTTNSDQTTGAGSAQAAVCVEDGEQC